MIPALSAGSFLGLGAAALVAGIRYGGEANGLTMVLAAHELRQPAPLPPPPNPELPPAP